MESDVARAQDVLDAFTVFVLGFEDYRTHLKRCLDSIFEQAVLLPAQCDIQPLRLDVRVGLNEPSSYLESLVQSYVAKGEIRDESVYVEPKNIHKYPLMRRMFNDPNNAIVTPYVMWFDDDSRFRKDASEKEWIWWTIYKLMQQSTASMIGDIWYKSLVGQQHRWVEAQPWYKGKHVPPGHKVSFVTGGWWTIRRDILVRHDWPITELDHRGGDVMLGELCRQQDYELMSFKRGLAINADLHTDKNASSKKRGFDSAPVGFDYRSP